MRPFSVANQIFATFSSVEGTSAVKMCAGGIGSVESFGEVFRSEASAS